MKLSDQRCERPDCDRIAVFGWGPPALQEQHWWCGEHAPPSFFDWLRTGRLPRRGRPPVRAASPAGLTRTGGSTESRKAPVHGGRPGGALSEAPRPGAERNLTGKDEARLVATAPPSRSTTKLLAGEFNS